MNILQRFAQARVKKLDAEAEENTIRAEVFAELKRLNLPQIVDVEGRCFLLRITHERQRACISMLEVATAIPPPNEKPTQKNEQPPAAKPTPIEVSAPKKPPAKTKTTRPAAPAKPLPKAPNGVRPISCSCTKEFAKAMTRAANDEGMTRAQWAENVIPDAYLSWVKGERVTEDPGLGDSQVVLTLSCEVHAQVMDFANFLGPNSTGAALRRLVFWTLRQGGYMGKK